MNKKYFTSLADFNNWADRKAIEWVDQLSNDQWQQVSASSFSSVEQTAIHIASAEKIWCDFWTKAPAPVFLSTEFKGSKNELVSIWEKASGNMKDFIENFPEENYEQLVKFHYPRGGEGHITYWQSFSHSINHSTYHRGQLVTLLRQAGFTQFSNMDLVNYYLTHK